MSDITVSTIWKGMQLTATMPEDASPELKAAIFEERYCFYTCAKNTTQENFDIHSRAYEEADTFLRLHHINKRRETGEPAIGVADLATMRKAGRYGKALPEIGEGLVWVQDAEED